MQKKLVGICTFKRKKKCDATSVPSEWHHQLVEVWGGGSSEARRYPNCEQHGLGAFVQQKELRRACRRKMLQRTVTSPELLTREAQQMQSSATEGSARMPPQIVSIQRVIPGESDVGGSSRWNFDGHVSGVRALLFTAPLRTLLMGAQSNREGLQGLPGLVLTLVLAQPRDDPSHRGSTGFRPPDPTVDEYLSTEPAKDTVEHLRWRVVPAALLGSRGWGFQGPGSRGWGFQGPKGGTPCSRVP